MILWRLKTQTVKFCLACLPGWTKKHNGQNAISFLPANAPSGSTVGVSAQNQNNKKDILCVTR